MTVAMKSQARWLVMERIEFFYIGVALMMLGTVLVVSSFIALGFTGTFLGEYQTQCSINEALNQIQFGADDESTH